MKLERALAVSSMLVAFSGILAFALTLEAALWLVIPAAALVSAGAYSPALLARLSVLEKLVTPITLAAFGFAVADFFFIGGSLVMAGADLMLILLCLKAVTLREQKDYVQLYAAGFFLLLASTGLSTEIYFILPFVMFFVSLTWALMLLTVKGEAESVSVRPASFRFGGPFFGTTALLTVCSFAVTLAIFFSIPRIGIGFMSKRAGGLLRTSGFSDTVDLGSMDEVKLDPTVVMRVHFPGFEQKPGFPLYWRGRTFDRYDGRSWSDTLGGRTTAYRNRMGAISLRADRPGATMVKQEIALEPLDTSTIFALNPAYAMSSDIQQVRIGRSGELFLPYPEGRRLHYTVYSMPVGGSSRPEDRPVQEYLQLPEGSRIVDEVAARLTAGARTEAEKAGLVMDYLAANQRYTLNPARDPSLSPIDDFLVGTRQGSCEHFATAAVLLLRSAGVYARMVSGFMDGEWNGYGRYLLVREQDAHTWVEAFIPGKGWRVYDPTPPAPVGEGGRAELGRFSSMLDYLQFRWDRYIVYYNIKDQLTVIGGLSDAYFGLKKYMSDAARSLKGDRQGADFKGLLRGAGGIGTGLAVLLIAAAAGLAAWRIVRRRSAAGKASTVRFYAEMTGLLEKKGITRRPGSTPREFARAVPAGMGRLNEGVAFVTEVYYRVRFGGVGPTPGEIRKIREFLASLKEAR